LAIFPQQQNRAGKAQMTDRTICLNRTCTCIRIFFTTCDRFKDEDKRLQLWLEAYLKASSLILKEEVTIKATQRLPNDPEPFLAVRVALEGLKCDNSAAQDRKTE
jgi:hypothetical protein